jgi:transcriptional regulator with XRE-family HTH domain
VNINYALIGARIKELRNLQGLTQEALAYFADLSPVFICNIEKAKKHPSLESLLAIADALGVTMDELLVGNQQINKSEYQTDIDLLLYDCSAPEKRFLYELLRSVKDALRTNSMELYYKDKQNK